MTKHRRLRVEPLEHRLLLAGDTYLINFQTADAPVPTRYAVDAGQQFGLRSNGWSYGWSIDHTTYARDREVAADQRLDTLIHFHQGQSWELAVPNGLYLTLNQGVAGEMATRINYVHVVGLPNGPNDGPALPTIMEPTVEGDIVNPADVHMEAIGFSDPNGDDHLSTDWEIWSVGGVPQRVWHTLGITGVERLHTHLGDGVFENSHAGRTDLISETVPDFNFNTYTIIIPGVTAGDQLTVSAEMLDAIGGSGAAISGMVDAFALLSPTNQSLLQDGSFELAVDGTQTSGSNWVMTTQFDGVEPSAQFQLAPWAASAGGKGVWFKGFRGSPESPVDARVHQVVTAPISGTYTLTFAAKVEENFPSVIDAFRISLSSNGTGGTQTLDLLEPP
jgi:hypothetical protein